MYDPFNGTGTTVLAAIKNGMYGIGTDLDVEYLDFSKQRISQYLKPAPEPVVKIKKTKFVTYANPDLVEIS